MLLHVFVKGNICYMIINIYFYFTLNQSYSSKRIDVVSMLNLAPH